MIDTMRKLFTLSSLLFVVLAGAASAKADTCSTTPGNLVANCGFETGSFSSWSGSSKTDNNSGVDGGDPYQGTYAAYLGSNGSTATLSQTLATIVGQQYTIQFALDETLYGASSGYPNSFVANFGSSVLLTLTNVGLSPYKLYSLTSTATSASTALSFVSRNDTGYFGLDDVSVTPAVAVTPEPSSLFLLGTGVLGALGVARRRIRS